MEDTLTTNIIVTQVPVSVGFTCPYCKEATEADYKEYKDTLEDMNWEYKKIKCPKCGGRYWQ